MFGYVRNIIIVGVVSSLAVIALPKNAQKSGKYVRLLGSLAVLAVILSPLKDMSEIFSAVKEKAREVSGTVDLTEEVPGENAVIGKTAENISSYIIKTCGEKFEIDTANVRVNLMLDESDVENVIIKEIKIYTKEHDRDVLDDAEKYFSELFSTRVFAFGP